MDRSRWVIGCLVFALASAGWATAAYGVPGRLVWGDPPAGEAPAGGTPHRHDPVRLVPAPSLAPIPMRYAPAWLPDGLRERLRTANVFGSPSTTVTRIWVPEGTPDPGGATTELLELGERGGLEPPYLRVEVEHRPDRPDAGDVLHDAVAEPGGYESSGDTWGFHWAPEPAVRVTVQQHGLILDRPTMYRIARSVRPVADEFSFPLQARRLPVGLTKVSWDSWVSATVRPDARSGGWSGSVNWCLPFEITVDRDGPPEAAADRRWQMSAGMRRNWYGTWSLVGATPKTWYGMRPLRDGYAKALLALEKRPGAVVTVSVLERGHHVMTRDELTRIAAAVDVPG